MSEFKMNPKVKALWLKALRSGEYEQTTELLVRRDPATGEDSFCCLGVLSNLYALAHPGTGFQKVRNVEGEDRFMMGGTCWQLSDEVAAWAGIPENHDPQIEENLGSCASPSQHLADMNDNMGYSFKQIARWIEKNL